MGEIEAFATRVKSLADEGQWQDLGRFARALEKQVQEFDLDRLPQTLQQFPEIIGKITDN